MQINFNKGDGLVPAIVQDSASGEILMLAFMNQESWERTVESGFVTFWSRSRQELWLKGESSGHRLTVREIRTDCDEDAILLKVEAEGPGVCHEGYRSCFFRKLEDGVWSIDRVRQFDPAEVYA